MTKLTKTFYIIMASIIIIEIVLDATKGHFDNWKLNTMGWMAIAFINELRAVKAEKKN
jgi:hypothetical protein